MRTRARLHAAVTGLALVALLSGCAGSSVPLPSTPPPSASASATPEPSLPPPDPEYIVGGTATQNLPYFEFVLARHVAAGGGTDGRSFIDALVTAGFDKAAMQVSPDVTPRGVATDSLLFSVRLPAVPPAPLAPDDPADPDDAADPADPETPVEPAPEVAAPENPWSCLLGQSRAGAVTSSVGTALGDGSCLIGKTRTIDW